MNTEAIRSTIPTIITGIKGLTGLILDNSFVGYDKHLKCIIVGCFFFRRGTCLANSVLKIVQKELWILYLSKCDPKKKIFDLWINHVHWS